MSILICCRSCGIARRDEILDLGLQPIAMARGRRRHFIDPTPEIVVDGVLDGVLNGVLDGVLEETTRIGAKRDRAQPRAKNAHVMHRLRVSA
jgi:hypothetical protein